MAKSLAEAENSERLSKRKNDEKIGLVGGIGGLNQIKMS
jgi:hypothetical protein